MQTVQLGFLVNDSELDPCNDSRLHPAQSRHLDVTSGYMMAILSLLIGNSKAKVSGFTLTRGAAKSEGKEFTFSNPRQMSPHEDSTLILLLKSLESSLGVPKGAVTDRVKFMIEIFGVAA